MPMVRLKVGVHIHRYKRVEDYSLPEMPMALLDTHLQPTCPTMTCSKVKVFLRWLLTTLLLRLVHITLRFRLQRHGQLRPKQPLR